MKMFIKLITTLSCISFSYSAAINNGFELSVIHLNDFHARFEEINKHSLTCTPPNEECIGGFTRLYSAIQKLKEDHPNSIVLDAGDNFQGTLWYTIYKWKAVQHFMNKIPFDAHTLGNHEFDDKIAGVVPYVKNLKAPVVVANIDDSEEPKFQGLTKKSIIVEKQGIRIGIIGVIASNTDELSSTEKLKFLDEIESVNKEANRLVQYERVDTIIVVSHSGYEVEMQIAKHAAPKIGLIIGGHSHSFLYTGKPPGGMKPIGEYPTVIEHSDGRKVLVVQAASYTKFLGHISVTYDGQGNVVSWFGKPIYLDDTIAQDASIRNEISQWKTAVDEYGNKVVGKTAVFLDGSSCRSAECTLGNFITDAMVYSISGTNRRNFKKYVPIAMQNAGGIRASLPIGEITVRNLLESQPFQNTFDFGELQGKFIKDALEYSASEAKVGFLQVSGIRVVYNMTNEVGSRVQSVKVLRTNDGTDPAYDDIEMNRYYTIVSNSFVMNGQDGFKVIPENIINYSEGKMDVEAIIEFLKVHNPVEHKIEGRIIVQK